MYKHKGVTIVELLGSIIIFSIASTIIALTVSFVLNANKQIMENGQANTAGTLLIRNIENDVNDLFITRYDYIENESLILYSDYEFMFDELSNDIQRVDFDVPLQTSIMFADGQLFLNNEIYALSTFTIHETSKIEMVSSTQFIITIVLASEDNIYTFKTSIKING